jgi:WD40 repeat protein
MPDNPPRSLRTVREINRPDILFSVARVPNSQRLLVGGSAGRVFEVQADQPPSKARTLANHGRYVTAVRLAGDQVISGGYDGRLIWWNLDGARVTRTVENAHASWIRHLELSPDDTTLASVGDDMVCRLWDAATGERRLELRGHDARTPQQFTSMLYTCAFSADGHTLATADRVGHVGIWEVPSGRSIASLEAPTFYTWDGVQRIRSIGGIRSLAFSPDGAHLAIGGVGRIGNVDGLEGPARVEVHDWSRGQRLYEFTGPNGIINYLRWHPENHWLCALGGGNSGIALVYDPVRRAMHFQGTVPTHVHDAAFSEDLTTLYAVGHRKCLVLEMRG